MNNPLNFGIKEPSLKHYKIYDSLTIQQLEDLKSKANEVQTAARKLRDSSHFKKILDAIFNFCIINGKMDKARCYLTGIAYLEDNLYAICPAKLKKLLDRDVSGINKNFKALNFEIIHNRADRYADLQMYFDFVSRKKLKKWSIRKCNNDEINSKIGSILDPENHSLFKI